MMRERPHPEQGYHSAVGIIALARRYERDRLDAACERALVINAISFSSVSAILKSGLDRASPAAEPVKATPIEIMSRLSHERSSQIPFNATPYPRS
jgi:transposase